MPTRRQRSFNAMDATGTMDFLLRILRLLRRSENPVTPASVFHLFVGAMGGDDHAW
jgi:hypothetical protein